MGEVGRREGWELRANSGAGAGGGRGPCPLSGYSGALPPGPDLRFCNCHRHQETRTGVAEGAAVLAPCIRLPQECSLRWPPGGRGHAHSRRAVPSWPLGAPSEPTASTGLPLVIPTSPTPKEARTGCHLPALAPTGRLPEPRKLQNPQPQDPKSQQHGQGRSTAGPTQMPPTTAPAVTLTPVP